jgi:endoglucanase
MTLISDFRNQIHALIPHFFSRIFARFCSQRPVRFGIALVLLLGISDFAWSQTTSGFDLLGRGVNYGNMLEAPREGEWGVRFDDKFPAMIKAAGFDSVRVPVRWSAATSGKAPFEIASDFLNRVQHVVDLNRKHGLNVVLNVHHFDELYDAPEAQRERFVAIWRQISSAFEGADEHLFFEILNEPHGNLTAEQWNPLLVEALTEIRQRHPDRWVIVGPDQWNSIHALSNFELPESDQRLIVSVHYYLPFAFTHQGAGWVTPRLPTGVKWGGTVDEKEAIDRDMQSVADWAKQHHRPIYLGEFGAYEEADLDSRATWTSYVRESCESRNFAWAYWELASGFGILDQDTHRWNEVLTGALLPDKNRDKE